MKKFSDGIAAPLVGEGAQIAYLLAGDADAFFQNLTSNLPSPLQPLNEFPKRAHRFSFHTRINSPDLKLHHMAMLCS